MGSCYSTKAAQMPQATDKSGSESPAKKNSDSQLRISKPTSVTTQKERGGLNAFGFNGKHGGKRSAVAGQNSNELSSNRQSGGDALKSVTGNTNYVVKSSPKSRFGFKKSSLTKSYDKEIDGPPSVSVNSKQSVHSKGSQQREVKLPPNSTGTNRKLLFGGKKPVTLLVQSDHKFKMIDDSESSQGDRLSSDTLDSKIDSIGGIGNVTVPKEDQINANIPTRTTAHSSLSNKENKTAERCQNEQDLNGNKNEIHSAGLPPTGKSSPSKKRGSKLSTKFLKRPFVKSKTFSGGEDEEGKDKTSALKSSNSKDTILSTSRKIDSSNSPSSTAKTNPHGRGSFLKWGFFSRQKSLPSSSDDKSSHNSEVQVTDWHDDENSVARSAEVKSGDETEVTEELNPEPEKRTYSADVHTDSKVVDEEEVFLENTHSTSKTTDNLEKTETSVGHDDSALSRTPVSTPNAIRHKIQTCISIDLQEKLENAHIRKGIAPIAMLDSVETTSIGSIGSDDLMLDMDIDLGQYDDQDDDLLDQSTTSYSYNDTKASRVIRNRSRSGSSRGRSNSRENCVNTSRQQAVKELRSMQSRDGSVVEVNDPRTNLIKDTTSASLSSSVPSYFNHQHHATHGISPAGVERRENWYRKRYNSQGSTEENESVDELHHLMDTQKPVQRRYTNTDKAAAATRPVSFPGGFNKQISDPNTKPQLHSESRLVSATSKAATTPTGSGSGNPVLRPPRIPSVSDDDKVIMASVDSFTYRQMTHDLTTLKTMLFKLKRTIQDDELGSPMGTPSWKNGLAFSSSQPGSPFAKFADRNFAGFITDHAKEKEQENNIENVMKENEDLKIQVHLLKQQLEEQDNTIKLLQQQMTKYENSGPRGSASANRDKANNGTKSDTKSDSLLRQKNNNNNNRTAKKSLHFTSNNNSTTTPVKPMSYGTTTAGSRVSSSKKSAMNSGGFQSTGAVTTTARSRPSNSPKTPDPFPKDQQRLSNITHPTTYLQTEVNSEDNMNNSNAENHSGDCLNKDADETEPDNIEFTAENSEKYVTESVVDDNVKKKPSIIAVKNKGIPKRFGDGFGNSKPSIKYKTVTEQQQRENVDPNISNNSDVAVDIKSTIGPADKVVSEQKCVVVKKLINNGQLASTSGLPRYGGHVNKNTLGKGLGSKLPTFSHNKLVATGRGTLSNKSLASSGSTC